MTLDEYTQRFMKEILNFRSVLTKIKQWDVNREEIDDQIREIDTTYIGLDGGSVDAFLANDWNRFETVLAKAMSENFYDENYVMGFLEFSSMKTMLEELFVVTPSDKSPYTRICNNLGIFAEIPAKFISAIYSADEFTYASNFIISSISDEVPDCKIYSEIDEYRQIVAPIAEKCIATLGEQGYFGTYNKETLTELMILYKLGAMYAPLYHASGIAKVVVSYDEIREFTNKKWNGDK